MAQEEQTGVEMPKRIRQPGDFERGVFLPSVLVKGEKGGQSPAESNHDNTMANEHPFQMLFETLGRLPVAHADSVNRQAYEILYDILSVPVEKTGRCILLRAPRAGHGKTHLLSRIQHHLGASHEFIPLHATFGARIDAASVIDDALRRLLRPLPASGGLCVLDLVARRLFAAALQPLVSSGEVPCQDREGALTALKTRPIETFDFHHPNAVTAHWARENFEVLGQRLSLELAQRSGLPIREVSFWVDALFRFAATPMENPVRLRVLADAVHAGNPADGVIMERLEALLGLLAQLMRVVLVADDLEGFSSDETAALKLAAFIGALRQSVERLDVILSLNQDIWQSAFIPRLSGGLKDRLSEVVVELNPLTEDEMIALLESRVPGLGERVLSRVDRGSAGDHARGLIRAAGIAWLKASAMDSQSPAAPVVEAVRPAAQQTQAGYMEAREPVPPAIQVAPPVPAPVVVEPAPYAPAPAFSAPPPVEPVAAPAAVAESEKPQSDFAEPAPAYEPEPFIPEISGETKPPLDSSFAAAPQLEIPPAVPVWNPPVESDFPVAAPLEPQGFVPSGPPPVESAFADFSGPPAVPVQPDPAPDLPDTYQSIPETFPPPYAPESPDPWSAPILDYSPGQPATPAVQAFPDSNESAGMEAAPEPAFVPDPPIVQDPSPVLTPQAAPEPDPIPGAASVPRAIRPRKHVKNFTNPLRTVVLWLLIPAAPA
jgi:hypothetical protein